MAEVAEGGLVRRTEVVQPPGRVSYGGNSEDVAESDGAVGRAEVASEEGEAADGSQGRRAY